MVEISIDFGTAFAGFAVLILALALALKIEEILEIVKNCNSNVGSSKNKPNDKDKNH